MENITLKREFLVAEFDDTTGTWATIGAPQFDDREQAVAKLQQRVATYGKYGRKFGILTRLISDWQNDA